jgi:spore photoproduct lyase
MFSALYIEHQIADHALTRSICERYPRLPRIYIDHYGEVFNRKAQDFRLQKQNPALILARKHKSHVLKAPNGYGFGNDNSYYFSHMLNCIYDCRYCFLQGMYRSAHYVLYVNFEDFATAITQHAEKHNSKKSYFYSGYDCDSLALEPISGFAEYFLPLFARHKDAVLELRTKSTQIRHFLHRDALDNVVIAYSFVPDMLSRQFEHKVADTERRISALQKLQVAGWPIALRFEPLIYHPHYIQLYQQLFEQLFSAIDASKLHSVSTGLFRMPDVYFKNLLKLYPKEPLLAAHLDSQQGMVSYTAEQEKAIFEFCETELLKYIPTSTYYRCSMGQQS